MRAIWAIGVVLLLSSCERKPEPPRLDVVGPRVLVPPTVVAAFGADCKASGGPGCESGLCLHVRDDYRCSQACGGTLGGCPGGWRCEAAHPSSAKRWCVPPVSQPAERAR